ncbi:hypothetical protein QWZ16_21360 [Vibrio ostreicida]|uniref:Uncharacterized protein n=1 Tax=Vibrio ostreicida TaxID=526588 RepID=A0ABT8BYB3_9VIBR|nr:hypothetical protein [Vibrio ostreicida]MDN3612146.1 hypothetical protein [Vibrio ostreicida]
MKASACRVYSITLLFKFQKERHFPALGGNKKAVQAVLYFRCVDTQ